MVSYGLSEPFSWLVNFSLIAIFQHDREVIGCPRNKIPIKKYVSPTSLD